METLWFVFLYFSFVVGLIGLAIGIAAVTGIIRR